MYMKNEHSEWGAGTNACATVRDGHSRVCHSEGRALTRAPVSTGTNACATMSAPVSERRALMHAPVSEGRALMGAPHWARGGALTAWGAGTHACPTVRGGKSCDIVRGGHSRVRLVDARVDGQAVDFVLHLLGHNVVDHAAPRCNIRIIKAQYNYLPFRSFFF